MKTETLRRFLAVHTWTGLLAGMALFIAFYAGALTVFQASTILWQKPELRAQALRPSDAQLQSLVGQVTAAEPSARENLWLYLPSAFAPRTFLFWHQAGTEGEVDRLFVLDEDGQARDLSAGSDLAHLVNRVHFSLGLPEKPGTWLMGLVSLLYALALLSGVLVHLPNLLRDLFALRPGRNLKRFWQDAHNAIGVLSLPFHVVFAFTGVLLCALAVFIAGLDYIGLDGRGIDLYKQASQVTVKREPAGVAAPTLPVDELLDRARERAPQLRPLFVNYRNHDDAAGTVNVYGDIDGYLVNYSVVTLDAATGEVLGVQLPGERNNMHTAVRAVTSLHFGTYGGLAVQWLYLLLGLGGAFLFYSGNLLWIESRRKRRQPRQPRAQRFMARLTVGVCLGCCIGLALAFVTALALHGQPALAQWEWRAYYLGFSGAVLWAQLRPPVRAAIELATAAAVATLAVPLCNALVTGDHLLATALAGQWQVFGVDAVALLLGFGFVAIARATARRVREGDPNSVWAAPPGATAPALALERDGTG